MAILDLTRGRCGRRGRGTCPARLGAAELVLLLAPATRKRSRKATDGQVWRDVTADDAFDDEPGQEGKRREKSDVTFDLAFALGNFMERCRPPLDEVAHP